MSMGLMSDHPYVFFCKDKMTEGVVHKTQYNMGIRTYALHTVHAPPFPYALHIVHTTALDLVQAYVCFDLAAFRVIKKC
jgi:hypothetical protein